MAEMTRAQHAQETIDLLDASPIASDRDAVVVAREVKFQILSLLKNIAAGGVRDPQSLGAMAARQARSEYNARESYEKNLKLESELEATRRLLDLSEKRERRQGALLEHQDAVIGRLVLRLEMAGVKEMA